jgi:hypothetical protein
MGRTRGTWTRRGLLTAGGTGILRFALAAPAYLLMVPLLVMWLGREKYGVWVLITTVTGWLFMSDLGLRTLIVRQAGVASSASERGGLEQTIRQAATIYAIVVAMVLLVATFSLGWIVRDVLAVPPNLVGVATRMLAVGVVAFCVDLVGLGLFRGVSDGMGFITLNNLVAIAYTWVRTALVLAVAFVTRDVVTMALASLVASVAGLIAWRVTAFRAAPRLRYGPVIPHRKDLGMLVGFSSLVQINDAVAGATPQLVEAFVVRRFGLSALGMFDVGVQLYTHARSMSFVSWFPVMPWLSSRVDEAARARITTTRLAGIAALGATVAVGAGSMVDPLIAMWLPLASGQEVATIRTLMCAGFIIGSIAPLVYSWNAFAVPWKTTVCLVAFAVAWVAPVASGFTQSVGQAGEVGLAAVCVAAASAYLLHAAGTPDRRPMYLLGISLMLISALAIGWSSEQGGLWVARLVGVVAAAVLPVVTRSTVRGGRGQVARS